MACFVGLVFWFGFFLFGVCAVSFWFFLILGDFRTKNRMMVVELLFPLHRKMECAFHCWILAGFSTYDKSLICLFSELDEEECGENDMGEKNNEGLS